MLLLSTLYVADITFSRWLDGHLGPNDALAAGQQCGVHLGMHCCVQHAACRVWVVPGGLQWPDFASLLRQLTLQSGGAVCVARRATLARPPPPPPFDVKDHRLFPRHSQCPRAVAHVVCNPSQGGPAVQPLTGTRALACSAAPSRAAQARALAAVTRCPPRAGRHRPGAAVQPRPGAAAAAAPGSRRCRATSGDAGQRCGQTCREPGSELSTRRVKGGGALDALGPRRGRGRLASLRARRGKLLATWVPARRPASLRHGRRPHAAVGSVFAPLCRHSCSVGDCRHCSWSRGRALHAGPPARRAGAAAAAGRARVDRAPSRAAQHTTCCTPMMLSTTLRLNSPQEPFSGTCTMHVRTGLALLGLALAAAGVAQAKPAPLSSSAIMFYDCEVRGHEPAQARDSRNGGGGRGCSSFPAARARGCRRTQPQY